MKKRVLSLLLALVMLLSGCQAQIEGVMDFVEDTLHKVGISAPWADSVPSVGTQPQPSTGTEPSGTDSVTEPTEPAGTVPGPTQPSTTVPPTPPTVVPTEPAVPPTEPTEPTVPPTEPPMPPTEPTVPPTEPVDPEIPNIPENTRYSITVWVSGHIADLTRRQIDEFNRTNPYGIWFDATVLEHNEGDAVYDYMNYGDQTGDIYSFIQDQTGRLVSMGGLSPLQVSGESWVKAENVGSSVQGVTVGDRLYGYPMTADNGYFMYYDKSVISDSDVDSLEALIAACEASGRGFSFELENSWYIASFFFATGCVSEWTVDENGNFTGLTDTFNSPEGIIAARGMQKLLTSSCYVNSSMTYDFEASIPSAIVVSGTWNYEHAKVVLGDNLGIADLPSFTVDGKSYHLSSFSGSKYLGVKPQDDPEKEQALHLLAQFLTEYDSQMERFEQAQWGPSNVFAQKSDAIRSAPQLQALFEQNRYAVPQGMIHGSWWDIARAVATNIREGADPADALQWYENALEALFELEDSRYAWSVIGGIENTSWTYDFPMIDLGDGIWMTENALYMEAGTEFKVRQGLSWEVNYGADGVMDGENFVVEATGTYYIVFDANTGMISLIAV